MCTVHTACTTLHSTMAHISSVTHPPGSSPPPTHTFFGNLGQFLQCGGCHIMTHVLLLVLPMSVYSVIGVTYFAITCPKTLADRFQRGTLLCDSALSLPLAAQFDNYITWAFFNSWHWGNGVLRLQVLRLSLSLRLAVTVYNHQFPVLHSGAFVWSTSQHQKD